MQKGAPAHRWHAQRASEVSAPLPCHWAFLDQLDRAVIPTDTRQIWVVAEVEGPRGPRFELVRRYNLSPVVPEDDTIVSVLPDAQGLLWFVTAGGASAR